jgi:hypothetical protein
MISSPGRDGLPAREGTGPDDVLAGFLRIGHGAEVGEGLELGEELVMRKDVKGCLRDVGNGPQPDSAIGASIGEPDDLRFG